MQEETQERQSKTNQQNQRSPALVIFKFCDSCHKNYEFVTDFWTFFEDTECSYCSQGDPLPEDFEELEFITIEDLEKHTPKRIQDCFSQINNEIPNEIKQEPDTKIKKHKKKKVSKDKPQTENIDYLAVK